jgi:hypothetical protein
MITTAAIILTVITMIFWVGKFAASCEFNTISKDVVVNVDDTVDVLVNVKVVVGEDV